MAFFLSPPSYLNTPWKYLFVFFCFSLPQLSSTVPASSKTPTVMRSEVSPANVAMHNYENPQNILGTQATIGRSRFMPVSTGYNTKTSHFIDLTTLDLSDQLLTMALPQMEEARSDYAVHNAVNYNDAFNWSSVLDTLRELAREEGYSWSQPRQYHVIAFYSQLYPEVKASKERSALLYDLDEAAFSAAMEGGGLLKYWFGKPDEEGRNLATCELNCACPLIFPVADSDRHLA